MSGVEGNSEGLRGLFSFLTVSVSPVAAAPPSAELKVFVLGSVLVPLSEPAAQRRESLAVLRVAAGAAAVMMEAVVQSGFSAVVAAPAAG